MTGLRQRALRGGGILVGIGISLAAAWAVRRAPWTENLTFLGGVVLVAPIYAAWLWTVHNSGRLMTRADETSDEANRALGLASSANHYAGQAYDAVRGVIQRMNAQERPERPLERPADPAPSPHTNPLTLRAQKRTQPVTTPRAAIDAIPGGARLVSKTTDEAWRARFTFRNDQAGAQ